jgi:DNA-binding transcriptional LysR family regulator
MLDLNDIVVFARVVEAGSFTAAARLLGMPKTTVSRRIAALEREVGVRLIQRTTRSLNMTDAGRLYYEQSSQALRTIEDANLRLAEARAEPSGTIRISAPVGFGGHFLTSAVFDFLAAYPKTKVELHLTDDTLNLVGNRIDLAFRTGILPDSTLIARKLGSTHRILCASPDYLARRGVPVASADLARHHCVIAGPSTDRAGCWTGRVSRKRSRCLDASPPMKCRRWLRNRHEDPAAQPVAEEQRLPDVVDEVTVLNNAGCSKIVRAAADRKDQCIVGKRPAGKLFPVRHRNGAELDSFSAPTQAREFPRPVSEVVPLRMRDETNVLVGVVGSSRCESMQHRFPDMRKVVIDEQNVGQLAARQPPAQVGCCDNPSDPATYDNDTVHISCPFYIASAPHGRSRSPAHSLATASTFCGPIQHLASAADRTGTQPAR